jgi:predicted nucleic-acid-binding Zn-ribbon protein
MADEKKFSFDDEKQKKAMDWFDQKWSKDNRKCEICSSQNWSLSQDVVMPITYSNKGLELGGRSYPQVMLTCKNCGNTKYFNTVVMGIIEGEKKGGKND